MRETLEAVQMFDKPQCEEFIKRIESLKEHWLNVYYQELLQEIPFYTLGVASTYSFPGRYLEPVDYHKVKHGLNEVLKENFSDLFKTFKEKLSDALQAKVIFDEELALPGFHVFLFHELFKSPVASVHFDMQYQYLRLTKGKIIPDEFYKSLTLPLELPKEGAGIRFWDIHRTDPDVATSFQSYNKHNSECHEYKEGLAALHCGNYLHRIEPCKNMEKTDRRITLQCHGIKRDGIWTFYW